MMDQQTSPLLANSLLGGGQPGLDPETLRMIAALKAALQGQGQGGQTFINPITQADALSTIRARDNQTNPIMGPTSNGIKFLFPGGRVMPGGPGGPGGGGDYQDAARSALIANLLSSGMQNLPGILGALRGQGK